MAECAFELIGEEETLKFGNKFGQILLAHVQASNNAICVFLEGDLGAGKTTMTRGLLRGQGYEGNVKSPTYTLVEPYTFPGFEIFHFDLYRLLDPEELEYMGIRDYFCKKALVLVEWPQKAQGHLPEADVTVELSYGKDRRNVVIRSAILSADELSSLTAMFVRKS